MGNYWKIHKQVKTYYSKIKVIRCPILGNKEIIFNQSGFRHFLLKDNVRRPIPDQIRRFKLLKYVKQIILNSSEISYSRKFYQEKITHFWSLTYRVDNKTIRVIIRQIGEGPKHFYSIMNKMQK